MSPDQNYTADGTTDILYTQVFIRAMKTMGLREMGRVISVLHAWLGQVRKDGRIMGFAKSRVALYRFQAQDADLPRAYVTARVMKHSWFISFSNSRPRREYLLVLEYVRDH